MQRRDLDVWVGIGIWIRFGLGIGIQLGFGLVDLVTMGLHTTLVDITLYWFGHMSHACIAGMHDCDEQAK